MKPFGYCRRAAVRGPRSSRSLQDRVQPSLSAVRMFTVPSGL